MGFCYLPPERIKMGQDGLPSDRVKLTVNTKKETNVRAKIGQQSNWATSQNGPRIKRGWCHLPPERVKLTVNKHQERNKQQGQNGLLFFTP